MTHAHLPPTPPAVRAAAPQIHLKKIIVQNGDRVAISQIDVTCVPDATRYAQILVSIPSGDATLVIPCDGVVRPVQVIDDAGAPKPTPAR